LNSKQYFVVLAAAAAAAVVVADDDLVDLFHCLIYPKRKIIYLQLFSA
jgi:hypothetical protein